MSLLSRMTARAEAERQEREAKAVQARLWLEVMKWAVAAGGLATAVFKLFGGE